MKVKPTACARMLAVVAVVILVAACGDGTGGGQSTGARSPATAPGDATPEAFPEGTVPAVLAADGRFEPLLRIPAVVACRRAEEIADGESVVVDGDRGIVVRSPDEARLAEVERRAELLSTVVRDRHGPGRTSDGHGVPSSPT
jgi:hypothetical protein